MKQKPLISCICVTNNRPGLLRKAILCFITQNYPKTELVISIPENDHSSKAVVSEMLLTTDFQLLLLERENEVSVGNARNEAIAKCSGDYVCIWDDDDWYHPSRLFYQLNSLEIEGIQYQASVLSRIILYDETSKYAYYSFSYTWDGTLLCRKEILLQNQYANRNFGEDTHVISFLERRKQLYHINTAPFLYIYIYHGENTWNYSHFEYFLSKSERFDEEMNNSVRMLIDI